HFSYSQLSQRYVPERDAAFVEPDVIKDDPELHEKFLNAAQATQDAYNDLLAGLQEKFADAPSKTLQRKQARQAARSILPNATETRIVVTGNYRAWRHFIAMRASEHADVEIRALAVECLRQLQKVAENVFADFVIATLPDGTEVASSPMVTEG
ncbi:MAG: FAD-dependent thymidylate synthase, partial [Thermocrispum sp.]